MPNLQVDPVGLNGYATECTRLAATLRSALADGTQGQRGDRRALHRVVPEALRLTDCSSRWAV